MSIKELYHLRLVVIRLRRLRRKMDRALKKLKKGGDRK